MAENSNDDQSGSSRNGRVRILYTECAEGKLQWVNGRTVSGFKVRHAPHWCGSWVHCKWHADGLGTLLHWTLDPCHLEESSQNQLGWIPNALNIDMIRPA